MPNRYINKLAGQRVLIVGGTSGIGFSVAESALEHGATVIVASSKPSSIDSAVTRLKRSYPELAHQVEAHTVDLLASDAEHQILRLLKDSTDSGQRPLDHIVLTAGAPPPLVSPSEFESSMLDQTQHIRLVVPILFAKHAPGQYLRISNRSSLVIAGGSNRPKRKWLVPTIFRHAMDGMTQALALELQPIRVNQVLPSATETPLMTKHLNQDQLEDFKKKFKDEFLTGVIAQPEDISETFLSAMKNTNQTGQSLYTDGGVNLAPGMKD